MISFSVEHGGERELATLWKMELQYYGKITCNFLQKALAKNTSDGKIGIEVKNRIHELRKADYIFLSQDGNVYSSKRGYLGKAEKVENTPKTSYNEEKSMVNIESITYPTPSEIFGGTSGAFERLQLGFDGFDGIRADVTLPSVSNLGTGEQPWVYYGFESDSDQIEGGWAYQTGTPRWLAYIRNGNDFRYELDTPFYDGDTLLNQKFYLKLNSIDNKYYAYFISGATQIFVMETTFTTLTDVSVKRNTTIARNGFDGTNILGKSMYQKWANAIVSKYNSDYYYSWDNYTQYSYWDGSMWYGTVDCTYDYVYRDGYGYTSIYKQ